MGFLVTGASGLLGTAFLEEMEAAGIPAAGWAHLHPRPGQRAVDLRDSAALWQALDEEWQLGARVLVHCAAMANVDACERDPELAREVNAAVPARLVAACHERGIRMVQISTDYVFDGEHGPFDEDTPPSPLQVYGRTKAEGEQAVLAAAGWSALVLRVPLLYRSAVAERTAGAERTGQPGRSALVRDDPVSTTLRKLASGDAFAADDRQMRQPTLTADVARITLRLVEREVTGLVHVAAQQGETQYGLAVKLARHGAGDENLVTPTTPNGADGRDRAARPARAWLRVKRLRELGLDPPRPLDEVRAATARAAQRGPG